MNNNTEATVIAFTEFYMENGQKINITVRQGAVQEDIKELLDNVFYLINISREYGLYTTQNERLNAQKTKRS